MLPAYLTGSLLIVPWELRKIGQERETSEAEGKDSDGPDLKPLRTFGEVILSDPALLDFPFPRPTLAATIDL